MQYIQFDHEGQLIVPQVGIQYSRNDNFLFVSKTCEKVVHMFTSSQAQ